MRDRPPGTVDYLATQSDSPDWDAFRSHRSGASYRELVEEIDRTQHGLCGYCEIQLRENDRQIEHFVPQSRGGELLDPRNLIACCTGGSSRRFAPDRPAADPDRYLKPLRRNLSCGQAKGSRSHRDMVDPRSLPMERLFDVKADGHLEPSEGVCEAGVAADQLRHNIDVLGLNVHRLRFARQRHWQNLADLSTFEDTEAMWEWIRINLLPDKSGSLARFFTTTRSYFGPLADRILEEDPMDWV